MALPLARAVLVSSSMPHVSDDSLDQQAAEPAQDPRISVMEWLVGIGQVVRRKMRGVPASPMVRLHDR